MTRQCKKCNRVSNGLFLKKKRCYYCGGTTERVVCRKIKDVNGFVPKEEIYGIRGV